MPTEKEKERGTFLVFSKHHHNDATTLDMDKGSSSMSLSLSSPSSPTYIHCNSKSEYTSPSDSVLKFSIENNYDKSKNDVSTERSNATNNTTTSSNTKCITKVPIIRHSSSSLSTESSTVTFSSKMSSDVNDDDNNNNTDSDNSTDNTTTKDHNMYAKQVNSALNLHLGLPLNPRNIKSIAIVCKIMSYFLSFVEEYLFQLWDYVPLKVRQSVRIYKPYSLI